MTVDTTLTGTHRLAGGALESVQPRRMRPVVWWAAIGGTVLVFEAYLFTRWVLGSHYKSIDAGPTDISGAMLAAIRIQEIAGVVAMVALLYWFIVRPWRRDGKLGWDGIFLLACLTLYWQDGLLNAGQYFALYNAHVVNIGSWYCYIPGWIAQNGCGMVEAPLWGGTFYTHACMFAAFFGGFMIRKFQARFPRAGVMRIIGFSFALFMLIDICVELIFLRTGVYTYPSSVPGFTLFHGEYYQFPLHEMIFWGPFWSFFAILRYFRNDRGESFAERGIDEVRAGPRAKSWLRGLALVGVLNVAMLVMYNLPMNIVALEYGGAWPKPTQERSYFTQGLCGEGTSYACVGPDIPYPRNNSIHLDPNGKVVVPTGTAPPEVVPLRK